MFTDALSSSSILLPGEDIRFQSLVSTTSLKRRPSKLLSITSKKKSKTRLLILTNNRLICVKVRKGGKTLAIRGEWAIQKVILGRDKSNSEKPKPDKEKKKGKDSVIQTVISVDPKGDNEFVVLTVRKTSLLRSNNDSQCFHQTTKSFSFRTEDSALRANWISNVQRVLDPAAAA